MSLQPFTDYLNSRFVNRETEIRLLLLGLIARQNTLFWGDPGTGKSNLTETFATASGYRYKRTQLTKFSTMEEVFGPLSLTALKQDLMIRNWQVSPANSEILFIDEIFKASGSILDSLLGLLEERAFSNGSDGTVDLPIEMVVAASNELPDPDGPQRAVWDRFAIRRTVAPLSRTTDLLALLNCVTTRGSAITHTGPVDLRTTIEQLRSAASAVDLQPVFNNLVQIRNLLAREKIKVSDRRLVVATKLIAAAAAMVGDTVANPNHLWVLKYCWWNAPAEEPVVAAIVTRAINPHAAKAQALEDAALEIGAKITGQRWSVDNVGQLAALKKQLVTTLDELANLPVCTETSQAAAVVDNLIVEADRTIRLMFG